MADVKLKPQVYKDPRPAEHFDRFHRRVCEHRPNWDYELVRTILAPYLLGFFRTRAYDTHSVPADGPCILAPNHFSFLDHFFLAIYLRRKVHFMAKSQLFKLPMWPIFNYGGVFPVRRGHADEQAFETARTILARGDIVVMYVEGGRSRSGELGTPRPGVGRLALETGVPVVPVGIVGSEKARNWKRLQFPKVSVRFGAPVRFDPIDAPTRDQAQYASERVFERIHALWSDLRAAGR
ncbi:MAG: lysophospholipid acyltransferase family protein [Thermoleophilaceae bacterium]